MKQIPRTAVIVIEYCIQWAETLHGIVWTCFFFLCDMLLIIYSIYISCVKLISGTMDLVDNFAGISVFQLRNTLMPSKPISRLKQVYWLFILFLFPWGVFGYFFKRDRGTSYKSKILSYARSMDWSLFFNFILFILLCIIFSHCTKMATLISFS